MAEAAMRVLLDKRRPGRVVVKSAGTAAAAGYPATRYAQEAVRMWDGDLRDHTSQPVTTELLASADLILTMTAEHLKEVNRLSPGARERSYLFKNFPDQSPIGEGVDDPIGQSLERYNETFLEIGEYLGKHLDEILRRIDQRQTV